MILLILYLSKHRQYDFMYHCFTSVDMIMTNAKPNAIILYYYNKQLMIRKRIKAWLFIETDIFFRFIHV